MRGLRGSVHNERGPLLLPLPHQWESAGVRGISAAHRYPPETQLLVQGLVVVMARVPCHLWSERPCGQASRRPDCDAPFGGSLRCSGPEGQQITRPRRPPSVLPLPNSVLRQDLLDAASGATFRSLRSSASHTGRRLACPQGLEWRCGVRSVARRPARATNWRVRSAGSLPDSLRHHHAGRVQGLSGGCWYRRPSGRTVLRLAILDAHHGSEGVLAGGLAEEAGLRLWEQALGLSKHVIEVTR